jgi:hypothetical protein
VRLRLAAITLVLAAFLADGAGEYGLAYYVLVAAVPVAALAALHGLGAVLDGSAAEPLDRLSIALSAFGLPLLLLATAVRAPLVGDGPPPRLGVTALVPCLAVLVVQAVLAGASALAVQQPALETD